jgi:hypothetical protein
VTAVADIVNDSATTNEDTAVNVRRFSESTGRFRCEAKPHPRPTGRFRVAESATCSQHRRFRVGKFPTRPRGGASALSVIAVTFIANAYNYALVRSPTAVGRCSHKWS